MKNKIILTLLLFAPAIFVQANLQRYTVEKSSILERELNFEISVVDKNDSWRIQFGNDFVKGESKDYEVTFKAIDKDKLKDLFGLMLSIQKDGETVALIPLEPKSKFDKSDGVSVKFLIKKTYLKESFLFLRCGTPIQEVMYEISLKDYIL